MRKQYFCKYFDVANAREHRPHVTDCYSLSGSLEKSEKMREKRASALRFSAFVKGCSKNFFFAITNAQHHIPATSKILFSGNES